jgi:hypothetical protein
MAKRSLKGCVLRQIMVLANDYLANDPRDDNFRDTVCPPRDREEYGGMQGRFRPAAQAGGVVTKHGNACVAPDVRQHRANQAIR